ncbi:CGNR zinc finger domain-containing protein [Microbacterium kyungheense]|uniref:Putative RNA-binding Zn ribbon-like protein n=1 Tax=Microbacterium kyungheense TaxID=1263636 RepID=A0A543EAJ6_9MICO|nr:ABATE domain-containing protein [Microbacterium kyungheense]TQM18588.1 putative RNA-binding Zn ribbon-like protein [Microbacterium kyungheense]
MIHAFPCGTLALDFVGTLRARRNDEPTEKLAVPTDLDAWFIESGLVPRAEASVAADLDAAVEVREAIYALVWARLHGQDLPADAVSTLNAVAAEPPLAAALTPDGWARSGTPRQALSHLAREAVEIVGGEEAALLRECSRPECTQVYLDTSRGHRREWCSMATCGSRMKAKAYRERRKADAS